MNIVELTYEKFYNKKLDIQNLDRQDFANILYYIWITMSITSRTHNIISKHLDFVNDGYYIKLNYKKHSNPKRLIKELETLNTSSLKTIHQLMLGIVTIKGKVSEVEKMLWFDRYEILSMLLVLHLLSQNKNLDQDAIFKSMFDGTNIQECEFIKLLQQQIYIWG